MVFDQIFFVKNLVCNLAGLIVQNKKALNNACRLVCSFAPMVKWYNATLPRLSPGFDSRLAHLFLFIVGFVGILSNLRGCLFYSSLSSFTGSFFLNR